MTTHTPRPWELSQGTGMAACFHVIRSADGTQVALVNTRPDMDQPAEPRLLANAKLIATSPDLLEALKVITTGFRALTTTAGPPSTGNRSREGYEDAQSRLAQAEAAIEAAVMKA